MAPVVLKDKRDSGWYVFFDVWFDSDGNHYYHYIKWDEVEIKSSRHDSSYYLSGPYYVECLKGETDYTFILNSCIMFLNSIINDLVQQLKLEL